MSETNQLMSTPRTVDIEITPRCNLRCSYCYFFDNPGECYEELPAAEWLQFFEELADCRVMSVCLAGGEPFIRADLRQLLGGVVKNRMRFSLLSNGGLIDDDIAAFLATTGRCDQVQISLDGSRAEVHDVFRGRGSFAGAVRGIRTLQRHRVSVGVRLTVHRRNVGDIAAAADFILGELGLPSFGTNAASYLGTCRSRQDDVALSLEDRFTAMEALLAAEKKYPGRILARAGPLADARTWRQMERARIDCAPAFPSCGRLTGCGCVFWRMSIRADGAMIPCTLLPHLTMGRINRDSLKEVWQKAAALAGMRDRTSMPLSESRHCAGCAYQSYCTGNCPALAYTITGEVHAPSPDSCLRDYLAAGGRIP